jgi:FkbM family methyltransferase
MSQATKPRPSKSNLLQRLKEAGVPITEIVDVGVREKTEELLKAFPEKRHHLFEPARPFFSDIRKNYIGIDYILYPMALSSSNLDMYLVEESLEKNGVVTHSRINEKPVLVDGLVITACRPVEVRKFSDLGLSIPKNFLLKVDVDGQDLNVIKGFGEQLSNASVVIVEATFRNFRERLEFLSSNGFHFFDIIDQAYYGPGLYQCDIAFIRTDLVNNLLRPPEADFKPDLWTPLGF